MFGREKESKEDKQQREMQKFVNKYGLEDLNENDLSKVKSIAGDLLGNCLIKTGMALSMAKSEEQLKVSYLSALVEQNWIIINMLSRISK